MAKAAAMSLNLVLTLSLLLLVSSTDGRLFTNEFAKASAPQTISCEAVHGVKKGETCFSVQQQFNLTPELFTSINPNLVCEKLFVGQWLCVAESA